MRPNSAFAYYLGSAESPTADFLQVWLKSSRSSDVASRACRPQVIWGLRPPSLYGQRLSRTVPAQLVEIAALCQIFCARLNFHHFLWKSQKSISASKCPITTPKIRTWSQLLSKFSCNTFGLLNRGRPRFWPRSLKTAIIPPWGVCGWGGLDKHRSPCAGYKARSSLRLNSCWPHSRLSVECLFPLLPPFSVSRELYSSP